LEEIGFYCSNVSGSSGKDSMKGRPMPQPKRDRPSCQQCPRAQGPRAKESGIAATGIYVHTYIASQCRQWKSTGEQLALAQAPVDYFYPFKSCAAQRYFNINHLLRSPVAFPHNATATFDEGSNLPLPLVAWHLRRAVGISSTRILAVDLLSTFHSAGHILAESKSHASSRMPHDTWHMRYI